MASILPFAQPDDRPHRSVGGAKRGRTDAAHSDGMNACEIVIFPGVRIEYHERTADVGTVSPEPEAGEPTPVGGKRGRKPARRSLSA